MLTWLNPGLGLASGGAASQLARSSLRRRKIFPLIYEDFRHLIISIDFAKSDRHKPLLLQHCPNLVIVDEGHSAADPAYIGSKDQQQRHALIKEIADNNK